MAFIPMGSGGALSETTLWTNNSPTSNFTSQTVTLSDGISNYKYIAFIVNMSTSVTDVSITFTFDASKITDWTSSDYRPLLGVYYTNNYYYYRVLTYVSNTSLTIGACIRNTASSAAGTNNAGVIPVKIVGLK